MADHLLDPGVNRVKKERKISVSGHLSEVRGIYHIKLSWSDEMGERQRKSISTGLTVKGNKKRAEEMLRDARKKKEVELDGKPSLEDLLFADLLEEWLEAVRPTVKLTTFGGYQMNVQRVIAPYFRNKGILLQRLTADDINDFYTEQLKRVKGMTISKFHANISSALKYAVEKEYITHTIMGKVKRPKIDRFVGKFLLESEAIRLFETVKGHKLELAVIFGAFYGLRRSEVVGLRWESINFEANTITIEHTVTEARVDGKKILLAGDTTKTKSSFRTLPLVPVIREKLLEVKTEQEKNKKLCGKSYNDAEGLYIYADVLGNRIKLNYISAEFPKFMTKHGFKRLRYHDLRHSCASLLLACGVSLKQIQEWLGHSDFAITANIYGHLDYSSKQEAAGKMTWIGTTPLIEQSKDDDASMQSLPDFINSLFANGVSPETIHGWLAKTDFTVSSLRFSDSFNEFISA